MKVWVSYAYSPRETANARGAYHIQVDGDFRLGRIKRSKGQTLCGKRFWGLDGSRSPKDFASAPCVRCDEIARRITEPILVHGKVLQSGKYGRVEWVPTLVELFPKETR